MALRAAGPVKMSLFVLGGRQLFVRKASSTRWNLFRNGIAGSSRVLRLHAHFFVEID